MSKPQRLGLIALAGLIAVAGFVLLRPDGDDEKAGGPGPPTRTAPREPSATASEPTATTDTRPEERVVLRGHRPVGGVERIEVKKGDFVRLVVESDTPDEIHLHGYDIDGRPGPGEPARFSFRANIEGVFEVDSHEAEDEGDEPLIATLVVAPG